jgi:hypothetical protein
MRQKLKRAILDAKLVRNLIKLSREAAICYVTNIEFD